MGYIPLEIKTLNVVGFEESFRAMRHPMRSYEKASPESNLRLASKLIKAGDQHGKALRGILAYAEMKCQIGWFVEWETYQVGVIRLSTSSTMHAIRGKRGAELVQEKQAMLPDTIYTQGFAASYPALGRIYYQRKNHRHPDWQIFCKWIETLPHAEDLIICERRYKE